VTDAPLENRSDQSHGVVIVLPGRRATKAETIKSHLRRFLTSDGMLWCLLAAGAPFNDAWLLERKRKEQEASSNRRPRTPTRPADGDDGRGLARDATRASRGSLRLSV
jgi:hypothetical protein